VGLRKCEITLINDLFGEKEGTYTIRLGFVAPANRRKFDISIQDRVVLENLDVLKETGGANRALVKEFKGIPVQDILSLELIPEKPDPELSQAPVINFIEVIREDTPEKTKPYVERRVLSPDEATKILTQAIEEQGNNNFNEALEKYHTLLRSTASTNFKIRAFEGMGTIASMKSLPEIKRYCEKLNPVMWDYKEPDKEIIDAAVKVYISIANNLATENKEKKKKMLNHSILLTNNPFIHNLAISSLTEIGSLAIYPLFDSTINGLEYKYYEGEWRNLPDFDQLIPLKSGHVFGFGLDEITPYRYNYAIDFSGYIKIPVDGSYTFYTSSDDGTKLYIGEELVVDNDGWHSVEKASGTIILKAGSYPIKLGYFQVTGEATMDVYFKGPGIEEQPIPASLLFKTSNNPV